MPSRITPLPIGTKLNRLTLERVEWCAIAVAHCACECGATTVLLYKNWADSTVKSCGCLGREWRVAQKAKKAARLAALPPKPARRQYVRARPFEALLGALSRPTIGAPSANERAVTMKERAGHERDRSTQGSHTAHQQSD